MKLRNFERKSVASTNDLQIIPLGDSTELLPPFLCCFRGHVRLQEDNDPPAISSCSEVRRILEHEASFGSVWRINAWQVVYITMPNIPALD